MHVALRGIACCVPMTAFALANAGASALTEAVTSNSVAVADAQALERISSTRNVRELLLAVPSVVSSRPVDEVQLVVDKSIARQIQPSYLQPGWSWVADGRGGTISGPPLGVGEQIAVAFDLPRDEHLGKFIDLVLYGDNRPLAKPRLPIIQLNPAQLIGDPALTIRLPQRLSPGDLIQFAPLDGKFTPGGGTWTIGGLNPTWNGSFDQPLYELSLPAGFGFGRERPLRVTFKDLWGVTLVDGPATDVIVGSPTAPASDHPTVSGCSPGVLIGNSFCVCGSFPPGSAAQLLLNGQPIDRYLVSSSPTILNFALPANSPAGPLRLDAGKSSGFDIADGARGVLIHVGGEIDSNRLKRGESTAFKLWLDGTDRPVDLKLWNSTPGIVTLEGGNNQVVTTSGGETNQVVRAVHAVKVGDFGLHYQLAVGSCPCANGPVDQLADDGLPLPGSPNGWDGTTVSYFPDGTVDDCLVEADACEQLLRNAEAAEAAARALRFTAERARQNQQWNDQRADAIDAKVEADRDHLATLRDKAGKWRELQKAAAEALAESEARAGKQPKEGWQESVDFGRQELARRAADQERMDAEIAKLEASVAQQLALASNLRHAASDAEAAATRADELARLARAAYEACRAQLASSCPRLVDAAPPTATAGTSETAPTSGLTPPNPNADICGPDISQAYTAALARVFQRMKAIPDSEKGAIDGTLFVQRNGWGIDQWPRNPVGSGCPSGACSQRGNDRKQACYRLFGHCVPAHVLNDTMFGFTAALVGVPETIQDLGANWAEGSVNPLDSGRSAYAPDLGGYLRAFWEAPDPELSRRCYRAGNAIAEEWGDGTWTTGPELGERLGEGWQGLLDEVLKLYPAIANCADCPGAAQISGWTRDWSRAPWTLSDGTRDLDARTRTAAGRE